MTTNPFSSQATGLIGPAAQIRPIVKSDTVDLPNGVCRAVLVGTPGTANLKDSAGNTLTGIPLQQGYNPIGVLRVMTGGTADNLWALY
jgi:hypothetical protein